ncbi:hypothetical protein Back2_04070 [Nocardioides baekrokdamisoli]|uniref:Prepilin-type N-terminal cleavage/methylation domain-containing protein n=1 Tax=Nocardioides baekrokdamisoli TaxID=1804624 RepID=A0A3G9IBC6_9ACTN|nr:type II secretion system protein [Nocardioides baekrokdamisoli]BBH16120.1 hypothetical protein Back2_04070 [Nocardioides baekrokdamisoli]
MLTRRGADDEGFTLIELLMTIAILGIIIVAIVGTLFAYLRNANETRARMSESTDQQFVSAYWQQDVSSLGTHGTPSGGSVSYGTGGSVWKPGDTVPSGVPSGCTSIANMVVGFAWNDYKSASTTDSTATWTTTNNASVYFTVTSGVQTELWRTRCNGSTVQTNILAHYLTQVPTVACSPATCNTQTPPATVSITLVVRNLSEAVHNSTGYTTTLTAERRQG